jgi:predicted Fe-S protein YdhL (DUF1289 family)
MSDAAALPNFDPHTATAALPSPCIKLCRIDAGGTYCTGCWRTLDEIAQWRGASEEHKRRIWLALQARAAAAERR